MSYILDALRKSERERTLGNIPSLATQAAAPVRRARRWALWVAGACALAAAAAGVAVWVQHAPAPLPGVVNAPDTRPKAPAGARTTPAATPGAQSAGPARANPPPRPDRPGTAAAALPRLSVLSYSASPPRRFVIVGETRYVEGDTLPGGFVLESITADGVWAVRGGERVLIRP